MNTLDILKYGHFTVLGSLNNVPQSEWHRPDVCGVWSVKEIVDHLTSFEWLLVEIFSSLLDEKHATPTLDRYMENGPQAFNDDEVERRHQQSPAETLAEYTETAEKSMFLAAQIPADLFRRNGILPWYGAEYDLDDFLVYTYYGHKREHMAQVDHFRDGLSK